MQDLSRHFGELKAVSEVSFEVEEGSIVSVIGPNGAGKSTLLNLITLEIPPTEGQVRFQKENLLNVKNEKLAKLRISRTYQHVKLFKMNQLTVLENIMIGFHHQLNYGFLASSLLFPAVRKKEQEIKDKSMEILRYLGIERLSDKQVTDLSFGDQRLVELGRALAVEPKLLILDELASGLNDIETERLTELLTDINKSGITILLVEHHMGLVMNLSDHIVVLNYGQKIAEGNPKSIQENPLVIEAYLGKEK